MVSPENNTNWLYDYEVIEDIIPVPNCNFSAPNLAFNWPPLQSLTNKDSSNFSAGIDGSFGESDTPKEKCLKKRMRSDSSCASSSKACREKLRRDKLNDKFLELGSVLEPERPPKTDKSAILVDAIRMVTQVRGESQKWKDSNSNLEEKIKELKAEKNELRDEKQRLKVEKEKLEHQVQVMNAQPSFMPHPAPAYSVQGGQPVAGSKMMPYIGYPGMGMAMWQFMPPASVDTSQDHVLRPPVA